MSFNHAGGDPTSHAFGSPHASDGQEHGMERGQPGPLSLAAPCWESQHPTQ